MKKKHTKIQKKCLHLNITKYDECCPDCYLDAIVATFELFEKTMETNQKLDKYYHNFFKAPINKII